MLISFLRYLTTSFHPKCFFQINGDNLPDGKDTWSLSLKILDLLIPKADKSKFRLISLAPCVCKILKKMIHNRLNSWIEYHNFLPSSQFGFWRSLSCIDNLSILYSNIIKSFKLNKATASIFLDIKLAYDNVLIDGKNHKRLAKLSMPPNTLHFIYNLTLSRWCFTLCTCLI